MDEPKTLTLEEGDITGNLRQGIEERIRDMKSFGGEIRITRVTIEYEQKKIEPTHRDFGPRLPRSHDPSRGNP